MKDKYNINFSQEILKRNKKRIINQMWKLIPMKENQEEWKGQLSVVIEELCGLASLFKQEQDYLILITKLEGLNTEFYNIDFMLYRKTVFRCIELFSRLNQYE